MNQLYKNDFFPVIIFFVAFTFLKPSLNAQYFYESDDANILLIQEKGNWNTSFSFFRNLKFETGNTSFQTGYSPLENFAVISNFFHTKNIRWNNETQNDYQKGNSTGLAFGYYYFFEKNRREEGLLFNSYLGINFGNYTFNFSQAGNGKVSYYKYYLQIGIHKIMNRLRISIVPRFGHLNIKSIKLFGRMPKEDFNELKYLAGQRRFRVQEFSIRISYRIQKLIIYSNFNFFLKDQSSSFEYSTNNYNLGLLFPIKT